MAVPFLSALRPPVLAALPGSATQGDTVVLATNGHLYTYNGAAWVDNGQAGGGGTATAAVIDFGPKPIRTKRFVVVDGTVTGTSKIAVFASAAPAPGRVGNDAEWDQLIFAAQPAAGQFTLTATATGRVVGKRNIFYQILP